MMAPHIPNREFVEPEFYKFMLQDFEDIRRRRKQLKGRPDEAQMAIIECEKEFESFYKKFLDL
jgi:malate synthase